MSGAIAPTATVKLYTAANTAYSYGLNLAMLRAVSDDTASVLSVSFGSCEAEQGASRDGRSTMRYGSRRRRKGKPWRVATGDAGSAGCDTSNSAYANLGLQVNGLASTPWDVAVGGTDFYYSDYASGGASIAKAWNTANDANLGSLIAPLPEQAWNDSKYGLNILTASSSIVTGGGGGQSSCAVPGAGANPITATGLVDCSNLAGFPKPAWQSGAGVSADGVRDLHGRCALCRKWGEL